MIERKKNVKNWESVGKSSSRFKEKKTTWSKKCYESIFIFEGFSAHSLILAAQQESQKKVDSKRGELKTPWPWMKVKQNVEL